MPTIVVLDTSLSMARVADPSATPPATYLELAQRGLDGWLKHLEHKFKLEHVAFLTCSSQCHLGCSFTRDVSEIRQKLFQVEPEDASLIIMCAREIAALVHDVWGASVPVNIILVTDGGLGMGQFSLSHLLMEEGMELGAPFPLPFPGRWSVVLLTPTESHIFKAAQPIYQRFMEQSGLGGEVVGLDRELTAQSVEKVFADLSQTHYQHYVGTLHFGDKLSSPITLCPPPSKYKKVQDFDFVEAVISDDLDIKGFLTLADVASPPVVSRHLILPWSGQMQREEDGRTPTLCVFLHGAMKVESLCALVQVASDWFGIIFSCPDVKKKSSLMLSLFEPGSQPVPWLGNLRKLGPVSDLNVTNQNPFPVRGMSKPSYSANPVVWTKQVNLHSDVQKILRSARKLPDKTKHFYEELNRLKRAALSLGFHELLEAMASTLERECAVLPPTSEPDCHLQLTHAAQELKSSRVFDLDYVIQPVGSRHGK